MNTRAQLQGDKEKGWQISAAWSRVVKYRTEEQVGRKRQDFGSSGEIAAL